MLPMIAVSGTRSTMRRSRWDRATAPSQWWQNPTLSFGTGYPQWGPSTSAVVDPPPIQANPAAARMKPSQNKVTRGIGHAGMCRQLCQHHGKGIAFHKCYQECMGPSRSQPGGTRAGARMASSSKRRMQVRAAARAARSMVSVGAHAPGHDPDWKKAGSCCESCHHGGHCEGGCGDNCNCGKEGRNANPTVSLRGVTYSTTPTMRMSPSHNPSTVLAGDLLFSPPTTSRLLNRSRRRITRMKAFRGKKPKCPTGTHRCGSFCCKNL